MSSTYIAILVFLFGALIALLIVWWYARRMKEDLEKPPPAIVGVREAIELAPANAERLRGLSAEPILLKQSEEGVRVQIEHRPMMPLMAFVGKDVSGALGEASVKVTEKYGARWVVLVSAREDGGVTVQRLA